jgi:hypothetical protein
MEELRVKSNNYAEENVNTVLKEAFAKVYSDGYRDGYKDCEEEISIELKDGETEYIDLGLPSGTMWSADYEKSDDDNYFFVPYADTKKYNIPNIEQWEELLNVCKWEYDKNGSFHEAYCIGPNGTILKFCLTGMVHVEHVVEKGNAYFWVSDENEGVEKSAVCICDRSMNGHNYTEKGIEKHFSGYKLPVRLVKSK